MRVNRNGPGEVAASRGPDQRGVDPMASTESSALAQPSTRHIRCDHEFLGLLNEAFPASTSTR